MLAFILSRHASPGMTKRENESLFKFCKALFKSCLALFNDYSNVKDKKTGVMCGLSGRATMLKIRKLALCAVLNR